MRGKIATVADAVHDNHLLVVCGDEMGSEQVLFHIQNLAPWVLELPDLLDCFDLESFRLKPQSLLDVEKQPNKLIIHPGITSGDAHIMYQLSRSEWIAISVFDVAGIKLRTLAE